MRYSMSAAFKMWLLHLDNGLSCGGSARASARHGRSVQDVSFASGRGHGSVLGMPPFAQVECLFRAPVEQAVSQANAAVLTSTEGMGGFSLPGAVRRFARAQIGLVSQAELGLWLGRAMAIRFLGSENTSTRTSLKRRILQSARMGPLRKCWNGLG